MRQRGALAAAAVVLVAAALWARCAGERSDVASPAAPRGVPDPRPTDAPATGALAAARPSSASASAPTVAPARDADLGPDPRVALDLVAGRVVEAGTARPLARAAVRATLALGLEVRGAADATTDADGRFSLALPAAALSRDEFAVAQVAVSARAPGHASGATRVPAAAARGDLVLELAARGVGVTGRVVTADGRPAPGAAVRLCGGGPWFEDTTDDDGRFVVVPTSPGTYEGFARSRRDGGARIAAFRFEGPDDVDLGIVTLAPRGVIEGHVVLPDGTPYVGAWLSARRAGGADDAAPCGEGADTARQVRAAEGGAFRFADLTPGAWVVGPPGAPRGAGDAKRTFATGTTGARVEVAIHVVSLTVIDEAGRPFPGADWEYDEIVGGDAGDGASGAGSLDERGRVDLEFDRPLRLAFEVASPTLSSGAVELEVLGDRWHVERTIVLHSKAAWGRIRLEVVDDVGAPISAFTADATPADRPIGSIGGTVRWPRPTGATADAVSEPARPGRYRVLLVPGQADFVPATPGGRCFAPMTAEIVVGAREEAVLHVVARAGGWLRATLRAPAGTSIGGRGRVVPAGDNPAPVPLGAWSDPADPHRWSGLASGGLQWYSRPLAPGRYVLHPTLRGGVAAAQPFEIRAGETTDVELDVSPAPSGGGR